MIKNIIKKTTIISAVSILSLQAGDHTSLKYTGDHYFSIGASYLNLEAPKFKIEDDSAALELGYGYRINRYFEIGTTLTVNLEDKITGNFIDKSVNINNSGGNLEVQEENNSYQNSTKSTFFAGLHAKASYPISKNFDIYATVGATYANIEHDSYYNNDNHSFIDNLPYGTTPETILKGISEGKNECELTGNEEVCGSPILKYNEKINDISPSYGIGLKWMFYDSGSTQIVNIGYKSLINTDDFKAQSLFINYEYQF